jgi:glycolate oxidase iron-sulfur subunit
VAYHDACHLAHAQRVTSQPRRLLTAIPNLTLREVPEGELCCGSAGTYNLEQPEIARELGERKAKNVLSTGAQAVVTGNIGCMMQIGTHLQAQGRSLPIWHTMELLDQAYGSSQ